MGGSEDGEDGEEEEENVMMSGCGGGRVTTRAL